MFSSSCLFLGRLIYNQRKEDLPFALRSEGKEAFVCGFAGDQNIKKWKRKTICGHSRRQVAQHPAQGRARRPAQSGDLNPVLWGKGISKATQRPFVTNFNVFKFTLSPFMHVYNVFLSYLTPYFFPLTPSFLYVSHWVQSALPKCTWMWELGHSPRKRLPSPSSHDCQSLSPRPGPWPALTF